MQWSQSSDGFQFGSSPQLKVAPFYHRFCLSNFSAESKMTPVFLDWHEGLLSVALRSRLWSPLF